MSKSKGKRVKEKPKKRKHRGLKVFFDNSNNTNCSYIKRIFFCHR